MPEPAATAHTDALHDDRGVAPDRRTPIPAVMVMTILASVGTGVMWSGIPFIAKHDYGFGKGENLLMYVVVGGMYIVGALVSGGLTRRLERWLSVRAVVALILLVQATVCVGPVTLEGRWVLWIAASIHTFLSAVFWPMIESYVTAGRHGQDMRRAIGWFNIVWTASVAGAMIVLAPFIGNEARLAIIGVGALNAFAIFTLIWFAPAPGEHDEERSQASVGPEYQMLLRCARVLLPMSYVMSSALAPLLPYLFARLSVAAFWETPATATWMVTRVFVMFVLWRLAFWHGRWGTLLLAAVAMTGGFALIVIAPSLWVMLAGFVCFGLGLAVVYYAALYYAMAVGRAQIDAGGKHESLIGLGYTLGPAAGLIGLLTAHGAEGDELAVAESVNVVAAVGILVAIGAVAALRPYVLARRLRRRSVVGATRAP